MKTADEQRLTDKKLVVFVGEGGVGKTSLAAATALAAAGRGRRVAVLTVDPAPRLGDALGLSCIDATAREVPLPQGCVPGGSLRAQRLDTKHTFDRMVESMSPNAESARVLLANPIYQAISTSLGGSEHYMTFQRLYELVEEKRYDMLVIDTPPAVHATDLLSTPVRLGALLETGAPGILADPARILARSGSRLAKTTALVLISVIEKVSGLTLSSQISEFITNFGAMLEDLSGRTEEINALLKADQTAFCLVTRPQSERVESTLAFASALAGHGIELDTVLINRITPARTGGGAGAGKRERRSVYAGAPAGTEESVHAMERAVEELRAHEAEALHALEAGFAERHQGAAIEKVVSLDRDVRGIGELAELAVTLFG